MSQKKKKIKLKIEKKVNIKQKDYRLKPWETDNHRTPGKKLCPSRPFVPYLT